MEISNNKESLKDSSNESSPAPEKDNISAGVTPSKGKGRKASIIAIAVLGSLFLVVGGAWGVSRYLNRINQCNPAGDDKICYELTDDSDEHKRVSIRNLDPSKKYRLTIKKRVEDKEIVVGSLDLDMEKREGKHNIPDTEPVEIRECHDNDGGKLKYIKGVTFGLDSVGGTDAYKSYEDECDGSQLKEFFCEDEGDTTGNGYVAMENVPCENGCVEGACREFTPESDPTPEPGIEKCEKEGGVNIYEKGRLFWSVQDYEVYDSCSDDPNKPNLLTEYYCEGDMYNADEVTCDNGCVDGACKESDPTLASEKCTKEGGKNIYEKGHLRSQGFEADDFCSITPATPYLLTEYYCDGDTYTREAVTCINGCENGACLPGGHGDSCNGDNICEPGTELQCKPSGRYGEMEKFCCYANECASVIPTQGTTDTGVANCVGDGGLDETHCMATPNTTCNPNGVWDNGNCTCPGETNGVCEPNCTEAEDPDCL